MPTDPPDDREPYSWLNLPPEERPPLWSNFSNRPVSPKPPYKPSKPSTAAIVIAVVLCVGGLVIAGLMVAAVVSSFNNFKLFSNK